MTTKKAHVEEVTTNTPSTGSGVSNILILSVLLISMALNVVALYLLMGYSLSFSQADDTLGIKRAILEVEYDKVGGKENYDMLTQAQLIQFKQSLPQLKEFLKSQGGDVGDSTGSETTATTDKVITADQKTKIASDAAYEGDKNATITVVEYSDMECPFCLKQYHSTQLKEKLLAQYGSGVNFVFKNNRGVNHPGTEPKAIASLCAQKVGGELAYIQFYNTILEKSPDGNNVYPVSKLADIAKDLKLDMKQWQKCYDNKETQDMFASQTAEAGMFNLNGTPGTLIVNNITGKYDTVEGAYPYESFTQKIDELMK